MNNLLHTSRDVECLSRNMQGEHRAQIYTYRYANRAAQILVMKKSFIDFLPGISGPVRERFYLNESD